MKAIIHAGGKGTRLYPVTLEIPKPLLPVGGKPILGHLLELFKEYGITEFKVPIHRDHVVHFENWRKNLSGVEKIDFFIVDEGVGTFGNLKKVQDEEPNFFKETIFVSNGDELKDINLSEMLDFHKSHGGIATIAITEVEEPEHYGIVVCEGEKIVKFLEKPKNSPSRFASFGTYIVDPEIMDFFPHKTLKFSMMEQDLFPKLAAERKLYGFKFTGQCFDCGTLDRWEHAMKNWRGIKK